MNVSSWCLLCRRCAVTKDRTICDRCERLQAIGMLVTAAKGRRVVDADVSDADIDEALSLALFCDTLEAIAFLMIERAKDHDRMNKAIRDESFAGQRAARDSYAEGQYDERQRGSDR